MTNQNTQSHGATNKITSFRDKHKFLSNFLYCKVKLKNHIYPSSEHAYMSFKSASKEWNEKCKDPSISPAYIKKLSRDIELLPQWDTMKYGIMTGCVRAKFYQNPNLAKLLISTAPLILENGNNYGDTYWGVCNKTKQGDNNLGRILMQIRQELSPSSQ